MDHVDCDSKKAKYLPTKELFMEEFEKIKELVWTAKKRGVMDVWLGCLATFFNADDGSEFRTEIPATNVCFFLLLTGSGCKAQTRSNGM